MIKTEKSVCYNLTINYAFTCKMYASTKNCALDIQKLEI